MEDYKTGDCYEAGLWSRSNIEAFVKDGNGINIAAQKSVDRQNIIDILVASGNLSEGVTADIIISAIGAQQSQCGFSAHDMATASADGFRAGQQSPAVAVPDEPKNPGAAYLQTFLNDSRFDAAVNSMPDSLIEKFYGRIVERTADRDDWKLYANNLEEDIDKLQSPRITEQDAREIAVSVFGYVGIGNFTAAFNSWFNDMGGRALLEKINGEKNGA